MKKICLFILTMLFLAPLANAADVICVWQAPDGDISHYRLYRAEQIDQGLTGPWEFVNQITSPATTYTDQNLPDDKNFAYVVTAVTPAGAESRASNVASTFKCADCPDCPPCPEPTGPPMGLTTQ